MKPARINLQNRLIISFGIVLLLIVFLTVVSAHLMEPTNKPAAILMLSLGGITLIIGIVLAWSIIKFIVRPLRTTIVIAKNMAQGELSEEFQATAVGELGELQQALSETNERMFKIVAKVRTGTTAVAATTNFISNDNSALSNRTESQASSLEETASSMEELTSTVKQNAENACQANTLVIAATESAEHGGDVVNNVVEAMSSIKERAKKIVEIISVIDGIAFQTNILALNAAVEAARAGDQGRGFAVVAAEVRILAQRSAISAKEIKTLIFDSVGAIEGGSKLVDDAGKAMQEIVDNIKGVAVIASEIASASAEQSQGIEEINHAIIQIDSMTQKNAYLVEQASITTSSLQDQAMSLSEAVSIFNLGAREFGTPEEAKEMVNNAIEYLAMYGEKQLIDEVNKLSQGKFIDRDLYISINDLKSTAIIAHGSNPRLIGMTSDKLKDAEGMFFVKDIIALVNRDGEGWSNYKWMHPFTKEILLKIVYAKKVGDLLFVCGCYRRT